MGCAALVSMALVVLACGGAKDNPAPTPTQATAGAGATGTTGARPGACVPGQSIGCAGSGGCTGYQVCGSDGAHYDACMCASPPEPIADASAADAADANPANAYNLACTAPDGQPLSMTSADVPAALAGRWWLCGGAAEFYFPVEFTADGHWYKLTYFNGSFQRNFGMDTSGTFTIAPQSSPSISFSMTVLLASGSAASGYSLGGTMQPTPPGLMHLGGGTHLRMTP
jgi:hypothetical protein